MKKASYLYSVVGISLVLFLLGTIGWLVLNGSALSRYFKENIAIEIILHDNTRDEKARELEVIMQEQSFVKNAEIITKEDAAKKYIEEQNEDFTLFLDFNPLYTSINVGLHAAYVNPDSLAKISAFIYQSNIVREVTYPQSVVSKLDDNIKKIGLVLGFIALILFAAVVVLIDNTVRLSMFSNRMLIKTMQMVGATRTFIARPFLKNAFISGFISGLIAVGGLFALRYFAFIVLPEMRSIDEPIWLYILMLVIVILGVIISVVSTYRSVVKYLKKKLDDLY